MTFRVNLDDGSTESFDLETPEGREGWRLLRLQAPESITGLALIAHGTSYAVPLPQKFGKIVFDAEPIEHRDGSGRIVGDVIRVYVDDIAVQLLVYRSRRAKGARLSIERTGNPVFIPSLEPQT